MTYNDHIWHAQHSAAQNQSIRWTFDDNLYVSSSRQFHAVCLWQSSDHNWYLYNERASRPYTLMITGLDSKSHPSVKNKCQLPFSLIISKWMVTDIWPLSIDANSTDLCVSIIMVALYNRADHYIFIMFLSSSFFFLLLFFPRLISAVGDWMFTILWHMVWP